MTFDPSAQPGAFEDRKPISAEEVLKLRAQVWSDGSVSPQEADRLFELNRSVAPSNEWTQFFVEAVCEFILSKSEPRGYVGAAEADWLINHIDKDGRIETRAELEIIVKLLEHADYAPESLRQFALHELEQSVLAAKRIDDAEAGLIRRLIFAPAGDEPAKVSAAEAVMLFRLKDATLGADNSPEWKKLFVQGVANHLMAHQGFVSPSPEEEMRLEQPYKADPFGHVLSRLGREVASAHEVEESLFGENQDERIAAFERAVAADAAVTSGESDWLKRLFEKDGARDELEQALVAALAEDGIRPF
jgi:hypothetical protein